MRWQVLADTTLATSYNDVVVGKWYYEKGTVICLFFVVEFNSGIIYQTLAFIGYLTLINLPLF